MASIERTAHPRFKRPITAHLREKSLEGQACRPRARPARRTPQGRRRHGRNSARSLRADGVPVPEIARKLVITSGKNRGERPSVATVYRVLAGDEAES